MGYGQFAVTRAKPVACHRVAWQLTHGEIPAGSWVLHRCDNRRCVRPDHLFLGTPADNTADMLAKGRGGWKTQGLPTDLRQAVVARYRAGGITQKQIAKEFGVSHGSVSNWVREAA